MVMTAAGPKTPQYLNKRLRRRVAVQAKQLRKMRKRLNRQTPPPTSAQTAEGGSANKSTPPDPAMQALWAERQRMLIIMRKYFSEKELKGC